MPLPTYHYGWIPVGMILSFFITIFVCYGLAVHRNHVQPFLPYISDTGIYYASLSHSIFLTISSHQE
eukprot:Pgem_evm1s12693